MATPAGLVITQSDQIFQPYPIDRNLSISGLAKRMQANVESENWRLGAPLALKTLYKLRQRLWMVIIPERQSMFFDNVDIHLWRKLAIDLEEFDQNIEDLVIKGEGDNSAKLLIPNFVRFAQAQQKRISEYEYWCFEELLIKSQREPKRTVEQLVKIVRQTPERFTYKAWYDSEYTLDFKAMKPASVSHN